jgi:hypothetical protein
MTPKDHQSAVADAPLWEFRALSGLKYIIGGL